MEQGEDVNQVYFVYNGSIMIQRRVKLPILNNQEILFNIVRLCEGGYYGEFYGIVDANSVYRLMAESRPKNPMKNTMGAETYEVCQVYQISEEKFDNLCKEYPVFRQKLAVKAELRNLYFKEILFQNISAYVYQMKV